MKRVLLLIALLWVTNVQAETLQRASPHFMYQEFACKCCGESKIKLQVILNLEKLRKMANAPIIITSGYRCPKHNREVGGAKRSQHCLGNAVDVKITGYTPTQVARMAKKCGFTWVKVYSTWTHLDIRGER